LFCYCCFGWTNTAVYLISILLSAARAATPHTCDGPSPRRTSGRGAGVPRAVSCLVQCLANTPHQAVHAACTASIVVLMLTEHGVHSDVCERGMHALLEGMQENSTCQALYMQGYSWGCTDEVLLHLCNVLKYKGSRLWCLNLGELHRVNRAGWEAFVAALPFTQVTHLYVSNNVAFSHSQKQKAQQQLRANRSKHMLHCSWWNERVIRKCNGCWWNPWNARDFQYSLWYKKHGGVLLVGAVFRAWRGCSK
jgi:hypothetical protein